MLNGAGAREVTFALALKSRSVRKIASRYSASIVPKIRPRPSANEVPKVKAPLTLSPPPASGAPILRDDSAPLN